MRLLGIRTGPDDVSIVVRGLRSMDPQWSCSTTLCVASSLAGSLPIPRSPNRTGSQRRLGRATRARIAPPRARQDSWTATACVSDDMPAAVLTEHTAHTQTAPTSERAASIALYSHIPGIAPPDAASAVMGFPGKPYVVLTAWLNPGADIGKALDHATNLLIQECVKKGVTNILVAHEPQPVKISADSGSLMPAVPNHWVTSGDLHASPGPHSRAAPH